MLWHMGPRQSLSEVVGTHVVLDCKWIITVFVRYIDIDGQRSYARTCALDM